MPGIEIVRPWVGLRSLLLVAGAALLLGAVACGGSSEPSSVEADIDGFKHVNLTIAVGDTVTWTNQDNAPHTVSHGVSPDVEGSPEFQSGIFSQNGIFSHTFDSAGTFAYFCEVHPSMVASVTVK